MRFLVGLLILVALFAGVRLSGMLDRYFLYFPEPLAEQDWKAVSGLPLEDVTLKTTDGVSLHGWWIPAGPADAPALVWCHGNAGNISNRLEHLAPLVKSGISVLIFDYRGYGRSEGVPSETGLYIDGEAALAHVLKERGVAPNKVVVFGQSLGSAVAAQLANQHADLAGLILETPFPSIIEAAHSLYGKHVPVEALLNARYDVGRRLAAVRMPVLVIHGDHDSILPLPLGRAVFEAANDPKEWLLIPGADHNDTFIVGGKTYYEALLGFIRRVTSS